MRLAVICGPTASGKTALAIELAKRLDGEVVSADSMQIYKEMHIGTAKPGISEMREVPHHMLDVVSVCDSYNVSRYVSEAKVCISDVISRGKLPILCGGTGLYIDSLVNNVVFVEMENDPEYREMLWHIAKEQGADAVHKLLESADPKTASRLHINDVKRVIRALEVCKITGRTMTEIRAESLGSREYDPVFICLDFKDRNKLYKRIEQRVDVMLENGLVDEAKELKKLKLSPTARAAIGYSEVFDFIDGKCSLEDARDMICKRTRNYAKRQLTWFRKNTEQNYFYPDETGFDVIVDKAAALIAGKERQ